MKLSLKINQILNKILVLERLKRWNITMLFLSMILWLTFYLGPLFMIMLGILNIITSIKIYQKNKNMIKLYWTLVVLNMLLMYYIMFSENLSLDFGNVALTMILLPYILSIFFNYILSKTY